MSRPAGGSNGSARTAKAGTWRGTCHGVRTETVRTKPLCGNGFTYYSSGSRRGAEENQSSTQARGAEEKGRSVHHIRSPLATLTLIYLGGKAAFWSGHPPVISSASLTRPYLQSTSVESLELSTLARPFTDLLWG